MLQSFVIILNSLLMSKIRIMAFKALAKNYLYASCTRCLYIFVTIIVFLRAQSIDIVKIYELPLLIYYVNRMPF